MRITRMRIPLPHPHRSTMRHYRPRRLQNTYNPHRGVGQTKTKLELFTLYECTMPSVLRPVDPSRFCVRLITRNMRRQQYSFFYHAINICACLYSVRDQKPSGTLYRSNLACSHHCPSTMFTPRASYLCTIVIVARYAQTRRGTIPHKPGFQCRQL